MTALEPRSAAAVGGSWPTSGYPELVVPSPAPTATETPSLIYLAGLKATSRRAMEGALERASRRLSGGTWGRDQQERRVVIGGACGHRELPWWRLHRGHLVALQTDLRAQGYPPSTVNHQLTPVRKVLEECWALGLMQRDAYKRAVRRLSLPARKESLAGRHVGRGEIEKLVEVCSMTREGWERAKKKEKTQALGGWRDYGNLGAHGLRDAALLALLYGGGLRRSEAAELQLDGLDLEASEGLMGDTGVVKVLGKGGVERVVPLIPGAREALREWLEARGNAEGPVLHRLSRGGRIVRQESRDCPITADAILKICAKRAAQAGLASFTPHDLRRSYATELLLEGVDVLIVKRLLGHARVETTERYDMRGEIEKAWAVKKLRFPVVRRQL